ncbi:putative peptidase A1 family protein [Lyophyllum shimeji]|uniref:Peptidase A1 family protein n=1 Tax=Lyophyllum shimeji TaxID=47721 RepID=A0A9P3PR61_LYOSH|nr:putative peptidase A1 family protein [Lyophyllum shimeji]
MRHPNLLFLGLVLAVQSSSVSSLKLPFIQRNTHPKTLIGVSNTKLGSLLAGDNDPDAVGNIGNVRYTTNITINGKEVYVALDTGSTDLWVIPPGGIGEFNDTGIPLYLRYGDGTYGVKGTIGVAPFEFGPYKIEKQAFLNANESTIGLMTDIGINGLFGLGFDNPRASPIKSAIQKKYGPSATWGASVLQNIFNQNTSTPNFIAVDLARTEDLEATAGGSFNIGEYDEEYASVANAPKLSQFPKNATRWTTLLEGIHVDGAPLKIESAIKGVPKDRAITLFDTGAPGTILPKKVKQELYSKFKDAVYDDVTHLWIVPCTATPNVEVILGNQKFPIHPLDLSEMTYAKIGGVNYTLCVDSIRGEDGVGRDEFEAVLGDSFLRNVYTVYDFGDRGADGSLSSPYMQFLSQVDPAKAAAQHVALRTKAIAERGPELPPKELLALLNGGATSTTGAAAPTGSVKTSVNLAPTEDDGTSDVARYAWIVIGLLAANLLVGLVLVALGVLSCVRRGTPKEGKPKAAHYVPVRFKDEDAGPAVGGYRDAEGSYDAPYQKSLS